MLKFPLFVQSINNLSDARYCAGMGVEMLGFCCDSSQPEFVNETLISGIMGWISGVKVVAQCDQMPIEEAIIIAEKIKADYILTHVSMQSYNQLTTIPIIYRLVIDENTPYFPPNGAYVLLETVNKDIKLLDYETQFKEFVEIYNYKLILSFGFDKDTIDEVYQTYSLYGFALEGGNELAPGLKSFDHLADILEAIEQ